MTKNKNLISTWYNEAGQKAIIHYEQDSEGRQWATFEREVIEDLLERVGLTRGD